MVYSKCNTGDVAGHVATLRLLGLQSKVVRRFQQSYNSRDGMAQGKR